MTTRRWLGVIRFIAGLGLLVWVLVATQAWRAFEHLADRPALLFVFVGQTLIGGSLEAQRLVLLVRSQGIQLPFLRSLRLVAMAVVFGYVVPGGVGGDLIKIVSLGDAHRERRVELAAVVLVDRVTGMISLLGVALSAALLSGSLGTAPTPLRALAGAAAFAMLAVFGGVVVAWSPAVRRSGLYRLATQRLPFHGVLSRTLDALWAFREHKIAILAALGLSAIGHVVLMASFVLAGRVIMPAAPASLVAWVSLLALVANVIPITPAGLGVGEAAFAGAFGLAGFAGGAQLLLAWRAGQVPFAIAGGLLAASGGRRPRAADNGIEAANG